MNKKIWSEIKKAKNILLTLHPSPDGDSIGSNLALFHSLTKMGKKVTLLGGDSEFPKNFSTLPGTDKILPKNFFQINQDDFDLFIIADIASPKLISRQGEIIFNKNLKTIIIDHHQSNPKFADINLVDAKTPATCQLIYNLFQENNIKITKNIAACLFIGIYTDTGGFKYTNTTYKTFLAAANLSKINPNYNKFIFELENNDHPDRLKFLSIILGSVKTYLSGKVAIASLDFETIKESKISNSVINGSEVANSIKSVTGWEIGISMIEYQPNYIKISFRTRDASKYDLSKISTAVGGGGHMAAAGATINGSLTEATDIILKNIKLLFPDLEKE
ncbi:MAG: DHH family phosphoesterase [Candidatus Shapirobacteria bacterium]